MNRRKTARKPSWNPEVIIERSPTDRAAAEADKQALLEELRETRQARPASLRSAPESLSSRPISDLGGHAPERLAPEPAITEPPVVTITPPPAPLIEEIDAEIAALQTQLAEAKRREATESQRIKANYEAEIRILGLRQAEAEARAKTARAARARVEQRPKPDQERLSLGRSPRERAVAILDRVSLCRFDLVSEFERAKRVQAAARKFNKEVGPGVQRLAAMTAFSDSPVTWPLALRQRFGPEVVLPARTLVTMLSNICVRTDQESPSDVINQAEWMTQSWTPGTKTATLVQLLSAINDDLLRDLNARITAISSAYERLTQEGDAYVRAGGKPVPVRMSAETEAIRQGMKAHLINSGIRDPRQNYAEGGGPIIPRGL